MYLSFLSSIWGAINQEIDLLKDSAIADYMFNGTSLWLVLISFFCGVVLLRFFLNPVSGGGIFSYIAYGQESKNRQLAEARAKTRDEYYKSRTQYFRSKTK